MVITETTRLLLRELTAADAASFYRLNSNPEVLRFTGDDPFSSVEAAARFLEQYPDYRCNGYGRWAVIRKSDAAFLGWCGLKKHPEGWTDIGYRFFQEYWGQGYATEAALACLHHGYEVLGLPKIIARAMVTNTASVRVMEKIGMTFSHEEEVEGLGRAVIYSRSSTIPISLFPVAKPIRYRT